MGMIQDFPALALQAGSSTDLPDYEDDVIDQEMEVEQGQETPTDNFWSNYKGIWGESVAVCQRTTRGPPYYCISRRPEAKLPKDPSRYPSFPRGADHNSPEEWAEAVALFWKSFKRGKSTEKSAALKAKKRTRDQSLGGSSKRIDNKTTPLAKKSTEGASKVANRSLSYALATAQLPS